ncbi:MAG: dCTP deaminase [Candidatus Lokiarchaeota archaeon]|nr:dCTP deaminase [Candidatus Lokiarchaeota archaeon]
MQYMQVRILRINGKIFNKIMIWWNFLILPDFEIKKAIKERRITIEPFDEKDVGPCSIDLHLNNVFSVFKMGNVVDFETDPSDNVETIKTDNKPFIIAPNQFVLASTIEKIKIPKDLAATLEGLSSVARRGIMVQAAGLVNPGTGIKNSSSLTLEVFCQNSSPVALIPGMRIIQIIFHELKGESKIGYDERKSSKYVGQKDEILL